MKDPCTYPRYGHYVHKLKTWPLPFAAVCSGRKTHEVRVNDRCFEVGDGILLEEFNPDTQRYTGATCLVAITYISKGGTFGLPENLCVMSIHLEEWANPNLDAVTD